MKVLVFAGTTEGRELISTISKKISVDACVATDYGKEILEHLGDNVNILSGRLTMLEMADLMKNGKYDLVVDTTHPYAEIVTKNIKEGAELANVKYLRILRDEEGNLIANNENVVFVASVLDAVAYLNSSKDKVLLTVGSKELEKFTKVNNYKERLFARVLPIGSIVNQCNELGYEGRQLICMQGPFTKESNVALINQLDTKIVVTKDGGKNGGFLEKYLGAMETGSTLLVIGRPKALEGVSIKEGIEFIEKLGNVTFDRKPEVTLEKEKDWFPLYVNIKDKKVLVVGGGTIATRRIKTLKEFSCNIKVVAKEISRELGNVEGIDCIIKSYDNQDCIGADYIIAATNDEELNIQIGKWAKSQGILVNVASHKEMCDFYFPAIVNSGNITVGITAQGLGHKETKEVSTRIRKLLKGDK